MALSIGSLIGYLELDDTQFARKADQADRKMQALKLNLDALDKSDPKVRIQVDAETAKIDDLRAKITDLKAQSAKGVDVRVKMTQALIDLSAVQAKVRDLTNDEVKIKTEVTGTAESIAKLEALKKKADEVRSGSSFGLGGAAAVFGPMTLPFLTSAAGGLFAMGSGALAAASGLGVLRLALSGFGAASQAFQSYQATMANLHGTPKQQAAQAAAAQITLNKSAYGSSSSPEMQAFVRTYVDTLAPKFREVQSSAQAGALPGITSAMRDLVPILPLLSHDALIVGHSMGTMAEDAAKALNSPFWREFVKFIGTDAQRDIPILANTFGNLFKGMATGIERFSPDGTSLLMWVDHFSQRFANWTAGSNFTTFMATVHRDAGAVENVVRPLVPLMEDLFKGMDTAGAAELNTVGLFFKGLSHLPTGAIVTLGEALPVIVVAMKGMKALGGIGSIAGKLSLGLGSGAGGVGGVLGKIAGVTGTPVFVTNWPGSFGGGSGLPGLGGGTSDSEGGVRTATAIAATRVLGVAGLALTLSGDSGPRPTGAASNLQKALGLDVNGLYEKSYLSSQLSTLIGLDTGKATRILNQFAKDSHASLQTVIAGFDLQPAFLKAQRDAAQSAAGFKQLLGGIPSKVTTKAELDKSPFVAGLIGLDSAKRAAMAPVVIPVHANTGAAQQAITDLALRLSGLGSLSPIIAKAFGSKPRRAGGGFVYGPGSGTSDSIDARLSNGEFVVRAAAASRYRGLLESINAAGYANGGAVSASMIRNTSTARSYGVAAWNETHGSSSAPQSVYVVNHGDIAAATERVASHAILNELVFREG